MKQQEPVDRFFSFKDRFSGFPLRASLWSLLASGLLCVQIVCIVVLVDLFDHSDVSNHAKRQVPAIADSDVKSERDDVPSDTASERPNSSGLVGLADSNRHSSVWGPATAWLSVRLPSLSDPNKFFSVLILLLAASSMLRGLAQNRSESLAAKEALQIAARQRQAIHRQTLRLGPSDVSDSGLDEVHALFHEQVEKVRTGIQNSIESFPRDIPRIILLILLAISFNWQVAFQCIVPALFCWYLIQRDRDRMRTRKGLLLDRGSQDLRLLSESLRKTRLVRGYGMEPFEQQQFEVHSRRFHDQQVLAIADSSWIRRLEYVAIVLSVMLLLYLLGVKVLLPVSNERHLSLSSLAGILACLLSIHPSLNQILESRGRRSQTNLAADRIGRYLNRIPEVGQAAGSRFLQPLSHQLDFESIHYSEANGKELLSGFNLTVEAGTTIALISFDPLEARSAAYLLPRFIEPRQGRILIDGQDTAWGTLESLRAETIFVGGEDPFFTGTVAENISCGNSRYTMQDINEAAKTAHANHFIMRLPQGYETVLGEHGEILAPGESFRLGIARAVLRDPALLIIEEPRESLDEDTKSLLDDSYTRVFKERTVILLPTRLSTLKRVDRIILLDNGQIAASGAYTALLKKSELFRHWEYVHYNAFRDRSGHEREESA